MPRDEHGVPGGEVVVNLADQVQKLPANAANFVEGSPLLFRQALQLGQERFHLLDFLLERKISDGISHERIAPAAWAEVDCLAERL